MTETARESVTDNGKPSGIATTTTVMAMITYWSNLTTSLDVSQCYFETLKAKNLQRRTTKITIADINPNLPISFAITYNFYCRGVFSSSSL